MGQIQYSDKYFDDTFEYRSRKASSEESSSSRDGMACNWSDRKVRTRRRVTHQQNQENQAQAHQGLLAK